jgi:hypothetical protein
LDSWGGVRGVEDGLADCWASEVTVASRTVNSRDLPNDVKFMRDSP